MADGDGFPRVSIILPTLNSERLSPLCLKSIVDQRYPREKMEIIVVDGGSKDDTVRICEEFKVDKILTNPYGTEEIGRPIAIREATGKIIALIDSDNILPDSDCMNSMLQPFSDESFMSTEPIGYTHRSRDNGLTRYCSLIGADDPLYCYIGNYDRYCSFKDRWTDLPIPWTDFGSYLKLPLNPQMTSGANGFLVRADALHKIKLVPFVHADITKRLSELENCYLAKVKTTIIHVHAKSWKVFAAKKLRRIRKWYTWKNARDYYPPLDKLRLLKFVLSSMTFVPTLLDARKGYRRVPDSVWLVHPIACFVTLLTYTCGYIEQMFLG